MLSINQLTVAYNHRKILHTVSLEVKTHQITALIGPNGAGKSTLIRAISGTIPIQQGEVWVNGTNISSLTTFERAKLLAVVPQERNLPGTFTVRQTITLGRTPYTGWFGRNQKEDEEKVNEAMKLAQVEALAERLIGELSGGEVQRVMLARALAQDAPVLLLDEPTTYLDLKHQSSLLNLIRQLSRTKGLSVLMVMHDLNIASIYSDRIALLHQGNLVSVGTPAEVLKAEILSPVYETQVQVITHPEYGTPLILPDGKLASEEN